MVVTLECTQKECKDSLPIYQYWEAIYYAGTSSVVFLLSTYAADFSAAQLEHLLGPPVGVPQLIHSYFLRLSAVRFFCQFLAYSRQPVQRDLSGSASRRLQRTHGRISA